VGFIIRSFLERQPPSEERGCPPPPIPNTKELHAVVTSETRFRKSGEVLQDYDLQGCEAFRLVNRYRVSEEPAAFIFRAIVRIFILIAVGTWNLKVNFLIFWGTTFFWKPTFRHEVSYRVVICRITWLCLETLCKTSLDIFQVQLYRKLL
jgi:hypothetical protein